MRLVFIDDCKRDGRRRGMGALIALGGVIFPQEAVAPYALGVENIYDDLGIPLKTEMKYSPPKDSFLQTERGRAAREALFDKVLDLAGDLGVTSVTVVWDIGRSIIGEARVKGNVLTYLYERVSVALDDVQDLGTLIADTPGGGRGDETKWLASTLELTDYGTPYVRPDRVVLPIVTAPSHHLRHLQLADLVVSSTTAVVAGGNAYADRLVPRLMRLAHRNALGLAGGAGIKLFPNELLNLHYVAFGEDSYAKVARNTGVSLPWHEWEYANDDGLDGP